MESASCKNIIRDQLINRPSAVGQEYPISWVLASEKLEQEYEAFKMDATVKSRKHSYSEIAWFKQNWFFCYSKRFL